VIVLILKNKQLGSDLAKALKEEGGRKVKVIDPDKVDYLETLFDNSVTAAVIDRHLPHLKGQAFTGVINSIAHKVPMVLIDEDTTKGKAGISPSVQNDLSDIVTVLRKANYATVMATLESCGVLSTKAKKGVGNSVAYYNPHIATKMLVKNEGLGILSIDASSFRKIEVEYGNEVYQKVKEVFQLLLFEMWGKPGCFRASDVLCRRSDHGNLYYVFMNRSRKTTPLPLPGVLEEVADRLNRIIQNALWTEMTLPASKKRLPPGIKDMPNVVVGFASAMYNPCLDPLETVSSAIEHCGRSAQIQAVRMKNRYREMMTTLIQAGDLLYPNYQAVFRLPSIKKEEYLKSAQNESIHPLQDHLFGFEALVRVRMDNVKSTMGQSVEVLDPKFMRPDVLFKIAQMTKVALELDQSCMRHAIKYSTGLPGVLMVNILPRNLYFIDYLKDILSSKSEIILEISETEMIHNLDLIEKVQSEISGQNIQIAADDFGKAYASLDRVIDMKPNIIKFDRSLIQDIHQDPVKIAYLNGLVQAARIMKTQVLAEGVEKWEELECLQKMGIDFVQGFLLHKPQPVEMVLDQLNIDIDSEEIDSVA